MSPTSTASLKGAATARPGRLMYLRTGAAFAPKAPDPTARPARKTPAIVTARLIVSSRPSRASRPPARLSPGSPASSSRSAISSTSTGQYARGPGPLRPRRQRTAAQDHRPPLRGHRVAAVDGAQQGPGDGGVRVGVAAAPHRGHDALLEARRVQQLVEGVLQRDQDPALGRARRRRGARAAPPRAPRERGAAPAPRAHSTAARQAASGPSPSRTAWATATTNAADASPQAGFGWVRRCPAGPARRRAPGRARGRRCRAGSRA